MGKVQDVFTNGSPGAVTRSADEIIISVRNASEKDIPFGAPVFLTDGAAGPFDTDSPQEAADFLGFAVRVADRTPDAYPRGQFSDPPESCWHAGDVMEVLTRGCIAVPTGSSGTAGGAVYIRRSDGEITASAGGAGTTVPLENVRIRSPRSLRDRCAEVAVNRRNIF